MTGPNPWARDIAAQATGRSAAGGDGDLPQHEVDVIHEAELRGYGMQPAGGDTDQAQWTVVHETEIEWLPGYGLLEVAEGARRGHEWALEATDALVALVRDHAAATRERDALRAVVRDVAWQFNEAVSLLREAHRAVDPGFSVVVDIEEGLPAIQAALEACAARAALGDGP